MSYTPSLADVDANILSDGGYEPSLSDIDPSILEDDQIKRLKYVTGGGRTLVDTARDVAAGAISGLGKGGQSIASALTGGYAPTVNFDEMVEPIRSPKKSIGGNLAEGIGEYLPYGIAGGSSLLGQLGAGGASGAALTNSNETNAGGLLPKGKLGGAIEGALLNMIIPGGAKIAEKLRPSKMFRGNLTSKELEKNLEITKGTETGLGDVIQSPFLKKRLENTLTSIPFSGANESLQRTGKEVLNRGENLLEGLAGNADKDKIPSIITDELTNQFKSHQEKKNALYDVFDRAADKSKVNLELPTFAKKANEYSDAISSTNLLKSEPDVAKVFNKLQNYKNPVVRTPGSIVDINGKPLTENISYPSFKEANILSSKLNILSKKAKMSPDPSERNLANVFGNLGRAIKNDIKSSIKNDPKLKAHFEEAETNYKNNFSSFLDKDIYKYVSGNADPETIVQKFLTTTPNADLAGKLAKLATKLPDHKSPQGKNLLGYAYFSRALDNEGNLNPSKLSTAIRKLGKNQFKVLIPDKNLRQSLRDYSKLENMNKEAQNLMFNPKTGQRTTDALVTSLLGMTGKALSGSLTGIGAATLPILAGKGMTKALTSPKLRESLVKEMIKDNAKFNTPAKIKAAEILSQGILDNRREKE